MTFTCNTVQAVADSDPFAFCSLCKVADRCCKQLAPLSHLPAPILSVTELDQIKRFVGRDITSCFDVSIEANSKKIARIRTRNDGSCVFHENGLCTIYDIRPFDCMIFPLDIFRIGFGFYWVIYRTFCNQEIQPAPIVAYGESLLAQQSPSFVTDFAWDISEFPCILEYTVLKEVRLNRPG